MRRIEVVRLKYCLKHQAPLAKRFWADVAAVQLGNAVQSVLAPYENVWLWGVFETARSRCERLAQQLERDVERFICGESVMPAGSYTFRGQYWQYLAQLAGQQYGVEAVESFCPRGELSDIIRRYGRGEASGRVGFFLKYPTSLSWEAKEKLEGLDRLLGIDYTCDVQEVTEYRETAYDASGTLHFDFSEPELRLTLMIDGFEERVSYWTIADDEEDRPPETVWAQQARRATLKERRTSQKLEWLLERCNNEAERVRYQRLHKKVQRAEIKKYVHVYALVKAQEQRAQAVREAHQVIDLTTPKPRKTPHKKMRFPKFPKEAFDGSWNPPPPWQEVVKVTRVVQVREAKAKETVKPPRELSSKLDPEVYAVYQGLLRFTDLLEQDTKSEVQRLRDLMTAVAVAFALADGELEGAKRYLEVKTTLERRAKLLLMSLAERIVLRDRQQDVLRQDAEYVASYYDVDAGNVSLQQLFEEEYEERLTEWLANNPEATVVPNEVYATLLDVEAAQARLEALQQQQRAFETMRQDLLSLTLVKPDPHLAHLEELVATTDKAHLRQGAVGELAKARVAFDEVLRSLAATLEGERQAIL
jgi:hypothetical protein